MKLKSIIFKKGIKEVHEAMTQGGFEGHLRMGILIGQETDDELIIEDVHIPLQHSSPEECTFCLDCPGEDAVGMIRCQPNSPTFHEVDDNTLGALAREVWFKGYVAISGDSVTKSAFLQTDKGSSIVKEDVPVEFDEE